MAKAKRWQLQEAKNKLSQVAEEAVQYGPQVITKRGEDAVVVISRAEYERLSRPRTSLVEFLSTSPLAGSGLVADRDPSPAREGESSSRLLAEQVVDQQPAAAPSLPKNPPAAQASRDPPGQGEAPQQQAVRQRHRAQPLRHPHTLQPPAPGLPESPD